MTTDAASDRTPSNHSDLAPGWWWRTMGLTRAHLVGVFVTETILGIAGAGFAIAGLIAPLDAGMRYLLVAVCFFLVQLSVLGSSILSLLFYIGFRIERMNETGQAPVE